MVPEKKQCSEDTVPLLSEMNPGSLPPITPMDENDMRIAVSPCADAFLVRANSLFIDESLGDVSVTGSSIPICHTRDVTGELWVGVDVGSTTAKVAVLNPAQKKVLHWRYLRHYTKQAKTVAGLLSGIHDLFPRATLKTCMCGSGAESIADMVGGCFIQEVIANSIAVTELFPSAKTCIELGGQDAKILFFRRNEASDRNELSDMRMNGSCAGGTGAFIDRMAVLLDVPIERFDKAARHGTTVFDISGRCGVFAKTDLQPLLNMGVNKDNLALSVFHAVAKQTITGLGHGMQLEPPVVFLGGPFTFNRRLIAVFAQHLGLSTEKIIVPPNPQVTVAIGAALGLGIMPPEAQKRYLGKQAVEELADGVRPVRYASQPHAQPFFRSDGEREAFRARHATTPFSARAIKQGTIQDVYIGIDAGSTTIKFVFIDGDGEVINLFYASNSGNPLDVVKKALCEMHDTYREGGCRLRVRGLGTTGYGEALMANVLGADFHTVETIAHAHAALREVPDATFVLDLGGQDMKAMRINNGVISDLFLNEACSAGCGSFIETLCLSLGIPIESVADMAFSARNPSQLGSRCTVFMNSSITTEQKNGKPIEDIIAGLCRSVIDNLFTKVIRCRNTSYLGDNIVVQGGTFKNDAVLRAFEERTTAAVVRPRHTGEMGALGIALLARDAMKARHDAESAFIGFDALRSFECIDSTYDRCTGCANRCKRTIMRFSNGTVHCAGNRCEKGNIASRPGQPSVSMRHDVPSLIRFREAALLLDYASATADLKRPGVIGIPRVLEFYNSLPFWKTLFTSLGFSVMVSPRSTQTLCGKGLRFLASDNICFPAKIAHGHVEYLIEQNVDRIFLPMMAAEPSTLADKRAVYMCPVVQGYPLVLREMNKPHMRIPCVVDTPAFNWHDEKMRRRQVIDYLFREYRIKADEARAALSKAAQALNAFRGSMETEGRRVLASIESDRGMGVILAGRPYHYDPFINHGVPEMFSSLSIPLMTLDSIPDRDRFDLSCVRPDLHNPFHSEIYCAALFAAAHPCMEIVQLVSFGCGHDAVISDELARIMGQVCGRQPLVLKIDEGEAWGAIGIRVRSFVETVRSRRR
ncbi:MAG: hypothetical protein JW768_13430 [Chitinispirillaceae bacterium]|nr:hypothetical protein [Chitinispirillaceae bacterium]